MKYSSFIGIDISKATFDAAFIAGDNLSIVEHQLFNNTEKGFKEMILWLKDKPGFKLQETIFCMEATGMYCYTLLNELPQTEAHIWLENPVQIKRSIGIARGKNDKVDAIRIAQYASRNTDKLRPWKPTREVIEQIKHLTGLRERMVETKKSLATPIEELKQTGNFKMANLLEKSSRRLLQDIDKHLVKIEKEILAIIHNDESLRKLYGLLISIVGIGFVTAINLIIYTNEFTILKDARKLACYSGISPFEYQSGSSVKGKTKVHPMANKKLKKCLHMAALTAIKHDKELKMYYERKLLEGKHAMSVLNAVRNKLVARVVAIVNKQQPYVKIAA